MMSEYTLAQRHFVLLAHGRRRIGSRFASKGNDTTRLARPWPVYTLS